MFLRWRRLAVRPSRAPSSASGQAQDERTAWLGTGGRVGGAGRMGGVLARGPRCWWAGALDSGSGAGMTGWGAGLFLRWRRLAVRPSRAPSNASGQAQDERTAWLGTGGRVGGAGRMGGVLARGPRCWWAGALDSGSGAGMTGWGAMDAGFPRRTPPAARAPFDFPQDERTASLVAQDEWLAENDGGWGGGA